MGSEQPAAIGVALVGVGKIARDQHIPSIAANPAFRLVAAASRSAEVDGVANFGTLDELLADATGVDAVALCTPPQVRHAHGACGPAKPASTSFWKSLPA